MAPPQRWGTTSALGFESGHLGLALAAIGLLSSTLIGGLGGARTLPGLAGGGSRPEAIRPRDTQRDQRRSHIRWPWLCNLPAWWACGWRGVAPATALAAWPAGSRRGGHGGRPCRPLVLGSLLVRCCAAGAANGHRRHPKRSQHPGGRSAGRRHRRAQLAACCRPTGSRSACWPEPAAWNSDQSLAPKLCPGLV